LAVSSLAVGAQSTSGRGRKYKAPPPTAHIEVTVLRAADTKPIENAAVIFHPMQGEKDEGAMEVKTNEDGKSVIDVLPIGDTVLLQVIAPGFQTYGKEYKIDKAAMTFHVRMNRPGEQYSIYENHDDSADAGSGSGSGQAASPANPKQSGASTQPAAQPAPSQPQPK
jgi:uncharacterized surface anchored protein